MEWELIAHLNGKLDIYNMRHEERAFRVILAAAAPGQIAWTCSTEIDAPYGVSLDQLLPSYAHQVGAQLAPTAEEARQQVERHIASLG
jgi:hypothetical protein